MGATSLVKVGAAAAGPAAARGTARADNTAVKSATGAERCMETAFRGGL
jgi:hypothetical protein